MTKDTDQEIGQKGKPFQTSKVKLPDGMRVKAPTREITGERFGRLVAVEVVGKHKSGSLLWRCVCDCGNEVNRKSSGLREGKGIQSCGCYLRERNKQHLASTGPWNKGATYATKKEGEVYANNKAWGTAVIRERGNKCEKCGWDKARCDVHHRVAKADGGLNTIENGIVLCPNCHRLEHAKNWANSAANDNQPPHQEEAA